MILSSMRHALIACHYLVRAYNEKRYVAAPEIAKQYNMNVRALMPALRELTRGGILRSRVGGPNPGFILSCHPQQIPMSNIFNVLQGEKYFDCCRNTMADVKCDCDDERDCKIYNLLNSAIIYSNEKLAKMSLEEYCDNEPNNKINVI